MKKKKYTYKNWIEYLNDNPKGYWFKRKLYGWGWTPATWQGWLVVLGFVLLVVLNSILLNSFGEPNTIDFVFFFLILILLIIGLILVGYKKGEKPAWTWGR